MSLNFHPHAVIGANINEKATPEDQKMTVSIKTSFAFPLALLCHFLIQQVKIIMQSLLVGSLFSSQARAWKSCWPITELLPTETGHIIFHVQQATEEFLRRFGPVSLGASVFLHGVSQWDPQQAPHQPSCPSLPSSFFLRLIVCATRTMQTKRLDSQVQHQWLHNHTTRSFGLTALRILGTYQSNRRVKRMTHYVDRMMFWNTGCQSVSLHLLDMKLNWHKAATILLYNWIMS